MPIGAMHRCTGLPYASIFRVDGEVEFCNAGVQSALNTRPIDLDVRRLTTYPNGCSWLELCFRKL